MPSAASNRIGFCIPDGELSSNRVRLFVTWPAAPRVAHADPNLAPSLPCLHTCLGTYTPGQMTGIMPSTPISSGPPRLPGLGNRYPERGLRLSFCYRYGSVCIAAEPTKGSRRDARMSSPSPRFSVFHVYRINSGTIIILGALSSRHHSPLRWLGRFCGLRMESLASTYRRNIHVLLRI